MTASAATLALFLSHNVLSAADLTWDGGGADTNWSTDLNWGGSTLSDGDHITFAGSTAITNVNDTTGLSLGSITLEGSSAWTIGSATSASVNGLSLSGGLTMAGTGNINFVSDLTLTAEQTLSNASTNYRTLTFDGNMTIDFGANDTTFHSALSGERTNRIALTTDTTIKGSGDIIKTGGGSVESQANASDFTGNLFINEGTWRVMNVTGLGTGAGTTTVADGATMLFQVTTSLNEEITVSGEGFHGTDPVQRGAFSYFNSVEHTGAITLGGSSTDIGFRPANATAKFSAGLDELSAGSGVVKVGSYRDPSAGFLYYTTTDVTYTGSTTVKGGGLVVDVNHGSDASRVAGYAVTYETLDESTSGVTGGITSQSALAGDGTVFLAAGEQITVSGADGTLVAMFAPGTITAATDVADFTSTIGSFTVDAGNAAAGVTFGDHSAYLAQLGSEGTSDLIEILNGALTITGSATLILDGSLEDGQVYTLAEYASITGTFASVTGLDAGWGLTYGLNELTLSQIPEPGTFAYLMGLTVLSFVGIRRRGKIA